MEFNNYYTGTSGLLLPVPNKSFYPEAYQDKSRLCYYASLTNSIEVNSSFYKMPQASTMRKWAADVPDDFVFTFKLFREITHNKGLAFNPAIAQQFMQVISAVEEKKGALLVQFPASVRIGHFSQLRHLLAVLRDQDPAMAWKIAVEFRHSSLYVDEVYELLATYQMAMVIHDKAPANSPIEDFDMGFVYLRFHGLNGDYKGSYPDDVLQEYACFIAEWLSEEKQVFVYFNNTMGMAYANLITLQQMVKDNQN